MQPFKTFLGLAFVLLVAVATTVEAAQHKDETEYCRKARKECQDKCKDMEMVGTAARPMETSEFAEQK
jgi:hypothetical protein